MCRIRIDRPSDVVTQHEFQHRRTTDIASSRNGLSSDQSLCWHPARFAGVCFCTGPHPGPILASHIWSTPDARLAAAANGFSLFLHQLSLLLNGERGVHSSICLHWVVSTTLTSFGSAIPDVEPVSISKSIPRRHLTLFRQAGACEMCTHGLVAKGGILGTFEMWQ
jgi:hypothetical protein